MDKIRVLMSTYNGERYLKEQIDSVLCQDGVEVSLYIRDDGSRDATLQILNEYEKRHKNVKVFHEKNIGCANSFFRLMGLGYDDTINYYAFCDQDDVWEKSKLKEAVSVLSGYEKNKMNMYCSNLWVTDETLTPIRKMYPTATYPDKVGAMIENIATGCTVVVNKAVLSFLQNKTVPQNPIMHDWWIYKICAFFGNVYFDEIPHICYRQHERNVLGAKQKGFLKKTGNFIHSSLEHEGSRYRSESAIEFLRTYGDMLSADDVMLIRILSEYNNSFMKRLRLVFSSSLCMKNASSNIRFKLRVLTGTV